MLPNSPRILHWKLTISIDTPRQRKTVWQLCKKKMFPPYLSLKINWLLLCDRRKDTPKKNEWQAIKSRFAHYFGSQLGDYFSCTLCLKKKKSTAMIQWCFPPFFLLWGTLVLHSHWNRSRIMKMKRNFPLCAATLQMWKSAESIPLVEIHNHICISKALNISRVRRLCLIQCFSNLFEHLRLFSFSWIIPTIFSEALRSSLVSFISYMGPRTQLINLIFLTIKQRWKY